MRKWYSGEEKQKVVEAKIREGLSNWEASKRFGITGHHTVEAWEKIYLEEGPGALYKGRRKEVVEEGKEQQKDKNEKELRKEIKYLRAEVAYLKKLNALVLEEELRDKKHRQSHN